VSAAVGISDYVRGLREKIGNDFLLMPAVGALLRDDEGRVLLVQHVEGRWQLPGGAVDPYEHPDDAIVRECLEEAGIDVEPVRIVGAFGGADYEITYENGDRAAYVVTVYEVRLVAGDPAPNDDETQAVGWFATDELDGLEIFRGTRTTLRALLRAS
jgi:8-oxo-dGTP pyrophosphatase MutT (NUDIX family)